MIILDTEAIEGLLNERREAQELLAVTDEDTPLQISAAEHAYVDVPNTLRAEFVELFRQTCTEVITSVDAKLALLGVTITEPAEQPSQEAAA